MHEAGFGKDHTKDSNIRGDRFLWLTSLVSPLEESIEEQQKVYSIKQLIYQKLDPIKYVINNYHSSYFHLDDQEVQLAVYNSQDKSNGYLRHKDAFRIDENNLQDGQKLRKITLIAYLNPEIPAKTKSSQLGELRLFLKDKIVDIVPRMGRIIIFKSEEVEHEVLPTVGYQRYALTFWYRCTYR